MDFFLIGIRGYSPPHVNHVNYRREASIKQEGIVGSEEEEKIPLEHYAMLEDAFRMHDTKGNGFLTKEDLRR